MDKKEQVICDFEMHFKIKNSFCWHSNLMTVIIPARQVWKQKLISEARSEKGCEKGSGFWKLDGMYTPTKNFQEDPAWDAGSYPICSNGSINCGSTVKRIVYFKWVFQFKNIMLNHFSTGPPIITEHTLQASEISESEAKLTVCTTSSVYCIAHTGRIISMSLADKTNKD